MCHRTPTVAAGIRELWLNLAGLFKDPKLTRQAPFLFFLK